MLIFLYGQGLQRLCIYRLRFWPVYHGKPENFPYKKALLPDYLKVCKICLQRNAYTLPLNNMQSGFLLYLYIEN